jgi:hypothetical protein
MDPRGSLPYLQKPTVHLIDVTVPFATCIKQVPVHNLGSSLQIHAIHGYRSTYLCCINSAVDSALIKEIFN